MNGSGYCRTIVACLAVLTASAACAGTTELKCGRFRLVLGDDGRPASLRALPADEEVLDRRSRGAGFYLQGPGPQRTALGDVSIGADGRLTARSADGARAVVFALHPAERYLALRIERLDGIPPEHGVSLHWEIDAQARAGMTELDYMTRIQNESYGARAHWDDLWHRTPGEPLGGVALYVRRDEADEDETLLDVWVGEHLPHPKIAGPWTIERARAWVADWQRLFADRSQMIVEGKDLDELRAAIPYAQRMQAKEIYLFTQTWRTDNFWPGRHGHVHVNRKVFPRGEEDLRAFGEELAAKGMLLKLHYVSGGIGKDDAARIGVKPDRRLASWAKGSLAQAVDADQRTVVFRPFTAVAWTGGDAATLGRPGNLPAFFEYNVVRMDDELIEVGAFAALDGGGLRLTGCRRGACGTVRAAHAAGGDVAGLVVPYNMNFVPDNDSTLLDEMAREFAGLLERCRIANTEYDGAEIHGYDGAWGYHKFAALVYGNLSHPVTAHDSSGRAPRCNFEYRLNSTRRLMRGACPFTHGGWNAPVQLDSPSRGATRLLDTHFVLSQGHYGGSLGLGRPEPMFSVSAPALRQFGLTDRMIQAVLDWKAAGRLMSDRQHDRLQAAFTPPTSRMPDRSGHRVSAVVPTVRKTAGGYAIVPVRVLTRPAGDIPWQLGQEHGPLGPRQYVQAGERLELVNPERAQVPGFVIRVLWAFQPDDVAAPAANPAAAAANLSLMPAAGQEIRDGGLGTLRREGDRLRVAADNRGETEAWECRRLPCWNRGADMTARRGVGLEIDGDGSGATLLVQIAGHGLRDYVVPIDFTGRRWIEIPHGDVAWSRACWGWRMETKHCDYAHVGQVKLGFGFVPPRTRAAVTVGRLQALAERPVTLVDPVLALGARRLTMRGRVASGEYIEYQGGAAATVYDGNWNKLRELAVAGSGEIPTGPLTVSLDAATRGPKPWLEVQITTDGEPMIVPGR